MGKKFDARIRFVAECLNQKLTVSANAASEWYVANNGYAMSLRDAVSAYKMWLGDDLKKALAWLNKKLDQELGEFPDLCFEAASRYCVKYEDLADAYDEQFAEV